MSSHCNSEGYVHSTGLFVQVALGDGQGLASNQLMDFSNPSGRHAAMQQQPTNLWDNLYRTGVISGLNAGGGQELAGAFQQLVINPSQGRHPTESEQSEVPDAQLQPTAQTSTADEDRSLPPHECSLVPGEFFLPATVWPGKAAKGFAVLSGSLLSSLGSQSSPGSSILIYKVDHFLNGPSRSRGLTIEGTLKLSMSVQACDPH